MLVPGARVLDVGSGSGYLCAAFYEMMGKEGKIVGVEHIPELVQDSIDNLNRKYKEAINDGSIVMKCADGRHGWKDLAPYNAIHVGAGKLL